VIVGLSFVTQGFHATARITFSIFQVPLISEFGWGRGDLGGAFSLMMIIYALTGPFIGSRFERLGPRAVMPWGPILIGISMAGGYFITSLWHVYLLLGVFLSVGHSCSGFAMHSALMPRWFSKKRGLATGIIFSGAGIGSLILVPIIERLIAHFGWRLAYIFFGRNRPEDVGHHLDGLPEKVKEETPSLSVSDGKAHGVVEVMGSLKGNHRFWMCAFINIIIGFCSNTILSQLQLYFVDANYAMASAAIILGMTGFFRIGGSVLTGWLSDRLGRPPTLAISAGLAASGIVLLLLAPGLGLAPLPGYLFAFIFGFGTGGMTTCFSALAADNFKGPSFAVVMGMLGIFYGIGGAIGPPLAGYTFDFVGSYTVPFLMIVLTLFLMILISLFGFKSQSIPIIAN
jgi:MFS family permease